MRILDTGLRATLAAILGACLLTIGGVAGAQETTSTLRGQITTPAGTPAANVDVRVTDTRTGSGRTLQTNSSGLFTADGLRVGGPYTVAVSSGQFSNQTVNDIFLTLGETYDLSLELRSAAMEELVVTASAVRTVETAVGPSSTFDLGDLQNAPAINRDIKDLIRIDPRIYVDEGFVDAIQCAGANPRFNSLTVDGVRLNDNFGLNSNGYPTERIPFSYDAIEQVAVELAPFDVQYGGFTACNINAVTKSGSNEFAGSVFYDYTDDSLSGDSLEDSIIDLGEFEEERYGLSIGGPIIRDRLFFFAAYEKLEGAAIFDRGPSGSGAGREIDGVSVADFEAIRDAAINIYGYDPGGTPPSLPEEDEKLLVKLDLNINDNHRASLTYNYNDGFTISEPDSDNDELEFSNHYYTRTSELSAYSAQLFSNWSDDFSTELKLGFIDLDNSQIPLAGTDFGEVQITTFNDPDGDGIVTVLSKHLDKGQGTATGLATLVADELDADWSQVRAEFAPAHAEVYANLLFGVQGTGGSTAIANSFMQ
ncbi:MAG: TonB-dependent receptor [Pseudomonadota bacterium]